MCSLNERSAGSSRVFKGIESDILPDGCSITPMRFCAGFDFRVASVHGQFRMDRASQTERIVRAVRNPFVTILRRITGRQLLRRPGDEVDVEEYPDGLRQPRRCRRDRSVKSLAPRSQRLALVSARPGTGLHVGVDPDARSTSEMEPCAMGRLPSREKVASAGPCP